MSDDEYVTTTPVPLSKSDRDNLIRIARQRAKQAEREADARAKTLLAEVLNDLAAEYDHQDQLWRDAVKISEEAVRATNARIVAQCAELGIPANRAPGVEVGWRSRSPETADQRRRAELKELAQARITALTQDAKAAIQAATLDVEERLILDGLESGRAKALLSELPTVEALMPTQSIDSLGVDRWQVADSAGAALSTPHTPADRKRRKVLKAIARHPEASDRTIATLAGVDHKTIAAYRSRGELVALPPGVGGELDGDEDDEDEAE
jgi:hypothetical protein